MTYSSEQFLAIAAVAIAFFAFGLGYASRWFHEGWSRKPQLTMDDDGNPFMRRFN